MAEAHASSNPCHNCSRAAGDPQYMDLSKLRLKSQIELEQLRAQVMAQEDELHSLEKERVVLLKKLRVRALERCVSPSKEHFCRAMPGRALLAATHGDRVLHVLVRDAQR